MFGRRAGVCALALIVVSASMAAAQPAPMPPDPVEVREADGHTTVRATRIAERIVLDGSLDEDVYAKVPSIGGFLQQEPEEGQPVTEKTEVWLLFDDSTIYVSARCFDSHPERDVASEMRRDGQGITDNESFNVIFDTFNDHRNGFQFQVGLAGGLADSYVTDERDNNRDWNTVWDGRTARFDGGWTLEMAIPFKSLRFKAGQTQTWGVNFKRVVRWKNEVQYLTRIPASLSRRGLYKLSSAATLVGIEAPEGRTFEIKPYAISRKTDLRPVGSESSSDFKGNGGFDVKLGVTEGLTADFTYNTDFAQVEEDTQQVNLTRFTVQFPEKREFFLEGQGIFSFGGISTSRFLPTNPVPDDIPLLFFSRRIGLEGGREVPIDVGGRMTGKVGAYSVGLLDIRTGDSAEAGVDATNFSVVRVKRDILSRSAIGVLVTDRSKSSVGSGRSQAYGVDGTFAFFQNLSVNTYFAKTDNPDQSGQDTSYRTQLDYNGDRYGVQLERLAADEGFDPDIGFLRRTAFIRSSMFLRFSPRPESSNAVRKFTWDVTYDYITDPGGTLESRKVQGGFRTELSSGDSVFVEVASLYEKLDEPFAIESAEIPVGEYSFPEVNVQYYFGPQRRASGFVALSRGQFYNGTRTGITTERPRFDISPQLVVEPNLTVNWITLPEDTFTQVLFTPRLTYTLTPRLSTSALVQYNSSTKNFNTNIRFRWEYQPGSDFFVVYSDNRDTSGTGFPELRGRGFVVKFTRLFRM